jgi:RND family efflux transporter MFP subunit
MTTIQRITAMALSVAGLGLGALAQAADSDALLDQANFECLIEPKMTVLVGAPTQGILDTVEVSRADVVKAGQLLATLKADVEIAALDQARVKATMKSEIQARQADLHLAKVNMQRIEELHAKRLVSAQERDESIAQLEVARMALLQARDNRKLHEYEFARARNVVKEHQIRSPISGVIVEQRAYPGEFVYENPVVTVAQIHPLKVEAILPARYFGDVQAGMAATIEPEIDVDGPLEVKVTSVDRVIDVASGTFSVHLELPNPDYRIPGGQRCSLALANLMARERLASRGRP